MARKKLSSKSSQVTKDKVTTVKQNEDKKIPDEPNEQEQSQAKTQEQKEQTSKTKQPQVESKPESNEQPKAEDKKDTTKKKQPNLYTQLTSQYYQRYKLFIKKRNPKQAINNFINIYNVVEQHPDILREVVDIFRKDKLLLSEKVALQGIQFVDKIKTVKISVFYHIVKSIVFNKDKDKINFDLVKDVIPEPLFVEYKKVLK
jgi:hypothetical protein